MESTNTTGAGKNRVNLPIDLRLLTGILLLVIIGMLAVWRPWTGRVTEKDQVVTVTGEAKVTDTPDEYVFSPSYQFQQTSKEVALMAMTKKSDEVVAGLKKLGVADNKIKTNSNGYDNNFYYEKTDTTITYNLQLTVTVADKDMAQKVQDYLVGTTPAGNVSPQAGFSEEKRKKLEDKARTAASKDARAKAEHSAKDIGFKVGRVKTVTDSQGFGVVPISASAATMAAGSSMDTKTTQLTLQPGENDLDYSVTVTYYIR